jgi:hypothetical protein
MAHHTNVRYMTNWKRNHIKTGYSTNWRYILQGVQLTKQNKNFFVPLCNVIFLNNFVSTSVSEMYKHQKQCKITSNISRNSAYSKLEYIFFPNLCYVKNELPLLKNTSCNPVRSWYEGQVGGGTGVVWVPNFTSHKLSKRFHPSDHW